MACQQPSGLGTLGGVWSLATGAGNDDTVVEMATIERRREEPPSGTLDGTMTLLQCLRSDFHVSFSYTGRKMLTWSPGRLEDRMTPPRLFAHCASSASRHALSIAVLRMSPQRDVATFGRPQPERGGIDTSCSTLISQSGTNARGIVPIESIDFDSRVRRGHPRSRILFRFHT